MKARQLQAMYRKGYRYYVSPQNGSFEPLCCKTVQDVVDVCKTYVNDRFDVSKIKADGSLEIKAQEIHNRTPFTADEIREFTVLKYVRNEWRQRNITLYQHPTEEDKIVSAGLSFDQTQVVVCVETKEEWARELGAKGMYVVTQ